MLQPFEDLLPYHEFSVRLAVKDVPLIVETLRSIGPEKEKQMRLAMARYWRAFQWQPERGGQAYRYTIDSLRRSLHAIRHH